jgi:hypothetical protein
VKPRLARLARKVPGLELLEGTFVRWDAQPPGLDNLDGVVMDRVDRAVIAATEPFSLWLIDRVQPDVP